MPNQADGNVFKLCHQFSVRGVPARRFAELSQWWLAINHQTTAVAYNPDSNEVRIAMLIEAASHDEAISEAQRQLGWLKEDAGGQQAEPPTSVPTWPEWAEMMLAPLYYRREQGAFPPTYRPTREPPPDLVAVARAMSNPAQDAEDAMADAEAYSRRTSILERPAPSGLYEALGKIAAHGAGLEQALGDLSSQLARVHGKTSPAGDPLFHYRGRFGDLVKRVKAAVVAATGYIGMDVLDATNKFLTQVEESLDVRNHFIHSQWWWYSHPDGSESLICRRLPQSLQDAEVTEWQIGNVDELLRFGSYFESLDLRARFLVAQVMTLADRIQGLEEAAGTVRAEIDVSSLTQEERTAILHRLEVGRAPQGMEFLGRVAHVEQRNGTTTDADPSSQPWIRIRPSGKEQGTSDP